MAELWVPMALAAIVLYGTSQVAQKLALRDLTAPQMITLSLFIAVPIYVVCLSPYLVSGEITEVEPWAMLLGLAAATFGQAGYYVYVEAAERGPISIVGSVTAAYPIMVIVVAIMFLGETPTNLQLAGVLTVTLSMIALTFVHGNTGTKSGFSGGYFALCIVTVTLWGLWAIFTKLTLNRIPPLLFLGIYSLVIVPTTVVYFRFKRLGIRESIPGWSVPLMIAIMSSEVGNIAFFLEVNAASLGPASIVFPLVATSPLVVVLLAYVFLRERMTRLEWGLVSAVILGIVLASTV
ncbi:MAG: DMT family transporter [Thermoplasmata archaeon]